MLKRSITGLILLILIAGFSALRLVSLYFFDALILVMIYACAFEVFSCLKKTKKQVSYIVFVYPICLFLIFAFVSETKMVLPLILLSVILIFFYLSAKELIKNAINRKKAIATQDEGEVNQKIFSEALNSLNVIVYPMSVLGLMFGLNHLGLNVGFVGIIMAFSITIFTDVFAYLFGRMIKGKKLCPEISPNKTISGMIFGAVGGVIVAVVGYVLFAHLGLLGDVFAGLRVYETIIIFVSLGLVGTFLTQFGDLVESAFKRKAGVKDLGKILPGHGGVMDRVDGLMFTSALVYILFTLFI